MLQVACFTRVRNASPHQEKTGHLQLYVWCHVGRMNSCSTVKVKKTYFKEKTKTTVHTLITCFMSTGEKNNLFPLHATNVERTKFEVYKRGSQNCQKQKMYNFFTF